MGYEIHGFHPFARQTVRMDLLYLGTGLQGPISPLRVCRAGPEHVAGVASSADGDVVVVGVLLAVDDLGVATVRVDGSIALIELPSTWQPVERGTMLEAVVAHVDVYPSGSTTVPGWRSSPTPSSVGNRGISGCTEWSSSATSRGHHRARTPCGATNSPISEPSAKFGK